MPTAKTPAANASTDEIQAVVVEAARTQLAATSAALKFWSSFAQAADGYARLVSDEIGRAGARSAMSSESVGRLTDITREYLRKLTELPTAAVQEFRDEVDAIVAKKPRRTRSARAKR
jgi:hypothetical protein